MERTDLLNRIKDEQEKSGYVSEGAMAEMARSVV